VQINTEFFRHISLEIIEKTTQSRIFIVLLACHKSSRRLPEVKASPTEFPAFVLYLLKPAMTDAHSFLRRVRAENPHPGDSSP